MRGLFLSVVAVAVCVLGAPMAFAQAPQGPQTLIISVDRANMRDKPTTTGSAVVATLSRGEQLEVIEATGTWYRVRVKSSGRTGYVSSTVVQAVPASAAAPAAVPPPAAPPPAPRPAAAAPAPTASPAAANPPAARAPASQAPPPVSMAAKPKIGFGAYVISDSESMKATKSFEAILVSGKSTVSSIGFGAEATNLWKGVFARFSYTHSSNVGSRAFVDSGLVAHSLNIPVTIEINPLEIGAGWRFPAKQMGSVSLVPYAGVGILIQQYKETSSFTTADENTDATDHGQSIFGGLEIGIKMVRIGVEGQFRSVPNALGVGGVSQAFGETNLGGAVLRLRFGVGF